MADQYTPAPAPSKTEFNTLNTQVQGLAEQIGTLNSKIKMQSTSQTTLLGVFNSMAECDILHIKVADLSTFTDLPSAISEYKYYGMLDFYSYASTLGKVVITGMNNGGTWKTIVCGKFGNTISVST